MKLNKIAQTRARESRTAIEKLYVEIRHLVNRGVYKPRGRTGNVIRNALLSLSPEIYGSMSDPEKVDLAGLVYVIDRLPKGIEACRFIKLISEEGYSESSFETIEPASRRRNCYRIDNEHMYIEVTRGRSEIYDILTHLTFLFIESEKIMFHALNEKDEPIIEWIKLGEIVSGKIKLHEGNQEIAYSYLSSVLGRTFEETRNACERLGTNPTKNSGLFEVVYWLGQLAMDEVLLQKERVISFTPTLRERMGHHVYGDRWANYVKKYLYEKGFMERPLHIISANLHSVMNTIYAYPALHDRFGKKVTIERLSLEMGKPENAALREIVSDYALSHGMTQLDDNTGTHITVQVFDLEALLEEPLSPELKLNKERIKKEKPIILVMDYAFGEQAYETLDELLKPFNLEEKTLPMNVKSISIMGKAGILEGGKGDIMVPTAHIFEGTADNYPVDNEFTAKDFKGTGPKVVEGPMITVLGTSLQNRDILAYFKSSSWKAVGLEMEGAHYQKAIQAQAVIRKNISRDVVIRYAYYASDNPLISGSTLASGPLGLNGVRPAYIITQKILEKILM